MKKILKIIVAFALSAALLLTGCTGVIGAGGGDLMAEIVPATWPAAPDQLDSKFSADVSDFSWDIFKNSGKNSGNVLISPVSIYLALGMALNGAQGETREAMLEALRSKGLTEEELNTACRDWISFLKQTSGKTQLSVADSIWYRLGFEADKEFLQKNADFFAAAARSLDFNKPEAVETINGWVKDNTKGVIDSIIDKIDADVVMYLINAVYFKGTWQTPFEASKSFDGQFAAPSGSVDVKYMHSESNLSYIDRDGALGVILPYDDGRFSFFAILPAEGTDVRAFLDSLDSASASELLSNLKEGTVNLTLPKFEIAYEDSLINELTDMGMGVAFDPGYADLSGMNASHEKDLYIGEVKHKTFCRVDELGTEAGAVTSVEIPLTAIAPENTVVITFDHPFIYGIMDGDTGLPLFLGLMEDPSKK
ncbi:MAG: serpin family protein [Bacillota bacterium]|nr:serpin family protein [Bacillota bacterium]